LLLSSDEFIIEHFELRSNCDSESNTTVRFSTKSNASSLSYTTRSKRQQKRLYQSTKINTTFICN